MISDAQKQQALLDGGASASSVRPFHIALGAIVPAQTAEPVAWVRKHPATGELSGDWLWNDVIEQCRKDSGVWFPLGFVTAPQPPAQADARERLTDEQILALNTGEVFFSESPTKYPEAGHGTQYHAGAPGVLKFARAAIALAAHSGQPDSRAEVTGAARERRHWKPEYNTDPIQRACGELPEGWEIRMCMENGAGWIDIYDPAGEKLEFDSDADHFDWCIHEAIDAARAGDAS